MKPDGGPAFPRGMITESQTGADGVIRHQSEMSDGMSLRDYFAAAALQGIISQYTSDQPPNVNAMAKEAYLCADAMLKAREEE